MLTKPEVAKQLRDEKQQREKSKDAKVQRSLNKTLHKTQTRIYPNSVENKVSSSSHEQ